MNRTKDLDRARSLTFVSFLLFVVAAVSALIPKVGPYLSLTLVLFGGFSMIIGKIIKDRATPSGLEKETTEETEENLA